MIGNALRIDIEAYAAEIDRNVLFSTTRAGKMTREMISRYVGGLHFMLTLTPIHLTIARDRAKALGDERLAAHFQHKLEEEVGHDEWAENDLKAIDAKRPARVEVMASAKALAKSNEVLIQENPALYLGYIAFVEYLTVILGPAWLKLLEERCGIPRSAMTAVGNHVELDREHAEEGFSVIDDLVTDPHMLVAMRAALAKTVACYNAYCAEAINGVVEEVAPAAHVSAA